MRTGIAILAAALASAAPAVARAQWNGGARAIPLLARADPVPGDSALSEVVLAQPTAWLSGRLWDGRLRLHAMLNAEGVVMANGQLATGVSGEGWTDKRHPHTWAHEIVVSLVDPVRLPALSWSLTAGKGFAPFGTDDPMNRPTILFPANHHWGQVVERAIAVVGVRFAHVALEAGLMNGDEPESPWQWPSWERFGDSWSARLTVMPGAGLELQASRGRVESPEHRQGAGLDHLMTDLSARLVRPLGAGELYALAEWARTSEEGVFEYRSLLAEAQVRVGRHRPYVRLERTDRPEEPRLFADPFRSVRPHNENGNLGITRWSGAVAGYGHTALERGPVSVEAVAEAAYLRVKVVSGAFLDPAGFYGRNELWLLSVGLRIGAFAPLHRMGRYGALEGPAGHPGHQDPDP